MDKNQKIVLEELKEECKTVSPLSAVGGFFNRFSFSTWVIYKSLTKQEEFEILKAFGKWGLKNEK